MQNSGAKKPISARQEAERRWGRSFADASGSMASPARHVPREYRDREKDARARAARTTDAQIRECLLQIAETWERMALYEERTHPQSGPLQD